MQTLRTGVLRVLVLAFFLLGPLATGCGDDDKSTPPPPPPPPPWGLPQTSAANCLANLKQAYTERNLDEYRKLFSDGFIFVFDLNDAIEPDNPTPAEWALADEMQAHAHMFADTTVENVSLSWIVGAPERNDLHRPGAWMVTVFITHLEVLTHAAPFEWLAYLVTEDRARFYFYEDSSGVLVDGKLPWYIFRWEDNPVMRLARTDGQRLGVVERTSWGQIKHHFH